jgi:hypothetical protein
LPQRLKTSLEKEKKKEIVARSVAQDIIKEMNSAAVE